MSQSEISSCLICSASLGHESKESHYPTCHQHRTCSVCKRSISSTELRALVTPELVEEMVDPTELLQHALCGIKANTLVHPTSTSKREILMLNVARLLLSAKMDCTPATNKEIAGNLIENLIVDQSFEETYMLLKIVESLQTRLSILCSKKDKGKVETQLAEIRKEAEKSRTRPVSTTNTTTNNKRYGIPLDQWNKLTKNEQTAIKNREKAIEAMLNIPGFTRELAIAAFDKAKKQEVK